MSDRYLFLRDGRLSENHIPSGRQLPRTPPFGNVMKHFDFTDEDSKETFEEPRQKVKADTSDQDTTFEIVTAKDWRSMLRGMKGYELTQSDLDFIKKMESQKLIKQLQLTSFGGLTECLKVVHKETSSPSTEITEDDLTSLLAVVTRADIQRVIEQKKVKIALMGTMVANRQKEEAQEREAYKALDMQINAQDEPEEEVEASEELRAAKRPAMRQGKGRTKPVKSTEKLHGTTNQSKPMKTKQKPARETRGPQKKAQESNPQESVPAVRGKGRPPGATASKPKKSEDAPSTSSQKQATASSQGRKNSAAAAGDAEDEVPKTGNSMLIREEAQERVRIENEIASEELKVQELMIQLSDLKSELEQQEEAYKALDMQINAQDEPEEEVEASEELRAAKRPAMRQGKGRTKPVKSTEKLHGTTNQSKPMKTKQKPARETRGPQKKAQESNPQESVPAVRGKGRPPGATASKPKKSEDAPSTSSQKQATASSQGRKNSAAAAGDAEDEVPKTGNSMLIREEAQERVRIENEIASEELKVQELMIQLSDLKSELEQQEEAYKALDMQINAQDEPEEEVEASEELRAAKRPAMRQGKGRTKPVKSTEKLHGTTNQSKPTKTKQKPARETRGPQKKAQESNPQESVPAVRGKGRPPGATASKPKKSEDAPSTSSQKQATASSQGRKNSAAAAGDAEDEVPKTGLRRSK